MELNATLFIQMFNFFVAWFFLRQFYFKPAMAFLEKKEREHDSLVQEMRFYQSELQLKEHEMSALWHSLNAYSAIHKPNIIHPDFFIFKNIAPLSKLIQLDTEHIQQLTRDVKEAIVTEASDVKL